jgi:hypothetical protein
MIYDYYRGVLRLDNQTSIEQAVFRQHQQEIADALRRLGIDFKEDHSITQWFSVTIKTDPPGAKIYLLTMLQWKLIEAQKGDPLTELKKHVLTTEGTILNGNYCYYLEWPDGKISGPYRTQVNSNGTVILR